MIECFTAWFLLIWGLVNEDALYLIAAGAFACAAQLYGIKHRMREG